MDRDFYFLLTMADSTPKAGPNAADAPEVTSENANVFGYDVASQAKRGNPAPQAPNVNSPLAAG